jgi:hypothetical protein
MPFRHASRILEELLGMYVSPETARRLCGEIGKRVEEQQALYAEASWKEEAHTPENEQRLAMSADGAMVPLMGGEWAMLHLINRHY